MTYLLTLQQCGHMTCQAKAMVIRGLTSIHMICTILHCSFKYCSDNNNPFIWLARWLVFTLQYELAKGWFAWPLYLLLYHLSALESTPWTPWINLNSPFLPCFFSTLFCSLNIVVRSQKNCPTIPEKMPDNTIKVAWYSKTRANTAQKMAYSNM